MLLITTAPGSGKLGGVVSTRTRAGSRFHARTARTQPRTASQTNARALTGALSQVWRSLTPAQRTTWGNLASGARSGFNVFIACNRQLLSLGSAPILQAPPVRPTFPPLYNFAATPVYNQPAPPRGLWGWQLDTTPEIPFGWGLVARATQALSPAKGNIRPSDLRIIAAASNLSTPALIPASSWLAIWGSGPYAGAVTWELTLIDMRSGFASPAVRATALYSATLPPGPTTWQTTQQQDGTTIAITTDTLYTQEGEPIAGP